MRTIVLAAIFASTVLCAFLGAYSYARARAKGRYYALAYLFLGAAIFAAAYGFELIQTSLAGIMRLVPIEYLGVSILTVSMLFVILEFKGADCHRPGLAVLVSIAPFVTVALAATSEWHGALYAALDFERRGGLAIFKPSYGPWYYVHLAYAYAIFIYGIYVFSRALRVGSQSRRAQAAFMLAGTLIPLASNAVYALGPVAIDLTPIAFAASGCFFATGFFRYRLFDMHPIARDSVFEHMRDPALVIGDEGAVLDHNGAAAAIFPALRDLPGERSLVELLDFCPELGSALSGGDGRGAITVTTPSGGERRYEAHRSRLAGPNGRRIGLLLLLHDVTERERLSRQLRELASIDELTRVRNRRSFYELATIELERARRHGRAIAFAVMDMNGFKAINDRFGHGAGDEALRLAARLCSDTLRSGDVLGRVGGDEFAFVFPECDEAGALAAVDKLRRVVGAATFSVGAATIRLSASFGVAGSAGPVHPDLEELLTLADKRMYQDKRKHATPSAPSKAAERPPAPRPKRSGRRAEA